MQSNARKRCQSANCSSKEFSVSVLGRFRSFQLHVMALAVAVASAVAYVVDSLTALMGGSQSKPAPATDVSGIYAAHSAAMQKKDEEFEARMASAETRFLDRFNSISADNKEEQKRLKEAFEADQARARKESEAEKERYEARIDALARSMEEAEGRVAGLQNEMAKPTKNRQAKLDFVNGLNLPITQTDSVLPVGPKGMGKTTFMWLLNKGDMPKQSFSDGTVEIIQLAGFMDSIGLRGWTPEELLKLLVLMIYEGIPKDLIIFGNDRIDLPVTSLGLLGIHHPLIVIMSNYFWRDYDPPAGSRKRINLVADLQGVRKVQPVEDLDLVYNLAVYADIKNLGLGTPVTHHDNIDALARSRSAAGVKPFKYLLETLGDTFTVGMENDSIIEALFRFVYVYEKKYGKDKLKFMNSGSLQDFQMLD